MPNMHQPDKHRQRHRHTRARARTHAHTHAHAHTVTHMLAHAHTRTHSHTSINPIFDALATCTMAERRRVDVAGGGILRPASRSRIRAHTCSILEFRSADSAEWGGEVPFCPPVIIPHHFSCRGSGGRGPPAVWRETLARTSIQPDVNGPSPPGDSGTYQPTTKGPLTKSGILQLEASRAQSEPMVRRLYRSQSLARFHATGNPTGTAVTVTDCQTNPSESSRQADHS